MSNEEILKSNLSVTDSLKALFHIDVIYSLMEAARKDEAERGWIAVENGLPDTLETVWISNGKGWTTLGCRSDLQDDGEGGLNWCWAAVSNGLIYEEDGIIIAECEGDDLDVRLWHRLPKPLKKQTNG